MLIHRQRGVVFVHIPKTAGTSVRAIIEPHGMVPPDFGASCGGAAGEALDSWHIPLAVLEAACPDVFDVVEAARAYALVRDPFERFPSSLAERMKKFGGGPLGMATRREARYALDEALELLSEPIDLDRALPKEWIHFQPQASYVNLRGRRIVQVLATPAHLGPWLEDLLRHLGAPPSTRPVGMTRRHINVARGYRWVSVSRWVERRFKPWAFRHLPTSLVRGVGPSLKRVLYTDQPFAVIDDLLRADRVREAVERAYAADVELYGHVASHGLDGVSTAGSGRRLGWR